MEITQDKLKEILHYDPVTGIFRWRLVANINQVKPWDVAGSTSGQKYIEIMIYGKSYKAHRLAWLYITGAWPVLHIDHIDGIRSNNSWANLREATMKQNMENKKRNRNNTSGHSGVSWHKTSKKWLARLGHNQNRIFLGYFESFEDAVQANIAKRAELHTHYTGRDQVNTFG
jgi:hypothetical protein